MDSDHDAAVLAQVSRVHRGLADRSAGACCCPATVLNLGAAVLFHGALEQSWLLSLNPFLDKAVLAQLDAEHGRLSEDLALLQSLWVADPLSPDVAALSTALLTRLRDHVARDERILYQSPAGRGIEPSRQEARHKTAGESHAQGA